MEKFFEKYKRFLGVFFLLWSFLWTAGKFGFDFGVDLVIFFRIFLWMFLVLMFWEAWTRRVFIKTVFWDTQKQISSELDQYPTAWSKAVHFFLLVFSSFWKLFNQFALSRVAILAFCALGILIDIFVFSFTSDLIILFLAGSWIWSIRSYKFEGRVSVAGALVFLVMCPFLLIFEKDLIAEKSAIWAYMFLVIGVIQMFFENLREERKSVNLAK